MHIKFGVDSSSRSPFRAWTHHRQTDRQAGRQTDTQTDKVTLTVSKLY